MLLGCERYEVFGFCESRDFVGFWRCLLYYNSSCMIIVARLFYWDHEIVIEIDKLNM